MSKQSEEMRRYFTLNGIKNKEIAEALGMNATCASNMLSGRDNIGAGRV